MIELSIVALSIFLQFFAAFMAFRLIPLTGRGTAWSLIAAAMMLMVVRRCISLFRMLSGDTVIKLDLNAELLALSISILLVVGISRVAPIFTDRKRAEEALWKSEEKFRTIFDMASDGILIADAATKKFLQGNTTICSMLGYTKEEIGRLAVHDIHPPEDIAHVLDVVEKQIKGEIVLAEGLPVLRKDGSIFYADINSSPATIGGIPYLVGIFRDITDQKKEQAALAQAAREWQRTFDATNDAIWILDKEQRVLRSNNAAERFFHRPCGELIGKHCWEIVHGTAQPIAECPILRAQKSLHRETMELHEGGRWFVVIADPILDAAGRYSGAVHIVSDTTVLKQAEEERRSLEKRLQRAEKMEALGQLAGGVAHDLNNVLGILSGYSELLLMEIPEGSRSRGHVEKIMQSTEKGASIIQDLLTLARRGVTASDVINLNRVVSGFLKTPVFEKLQDFHPRVTFRTERDKDLLNIKGSPVHLEKTLMNLVLNAAESIVGGGEVTIRTESRYLDKAVRGYDEVKDGDYAVLTVSDTGVGIPAENREKIFEPFFTKKMMGRSGTGLGLAIVWGTVKDHNGYIDLETEVGKGTTFTLYFPATREERTVPQQKAPIEQFMGNGEALLVVDDIAEQRDVAAGLLTRLGYQVHVVASGEEAVEYLKGNQADLLVLDMIMAPGIDGLETYERVLAINPKQKAIIVSGFSATDRVREAQKLGAGAYVKKPYMMETIGRAVKQELKQK